MYSSNFAIELLPKFLKTFMIQPDSGLPYFNSLDEVVSTYSVLLSSWIREHECETNDK